VSKPGDCATLRRLFAFLPVDECYRDNGMVRRLAGQPVMIRLAISQTEDHHANQVDRNRSRQDHVSSHHIGNPYLRRMFIHGARAVVLRVKREGSSLGQWMSGLETRTARNVVIVATANKLARISWAVLASGNDYHPRHKALSGFRKCRDGNHQRFDGEPTAMLVHFGCSQRRCSGTAATGSTRSQTDNVSSK
jgi:hypothetical protein